MFRNFMLLLLFLLVPVHAFVIELAPFSYRDPRSLSLGGITVFGIPGIHTLHSNPAAYSQDDDVLYTMISAVPHLSIQPDMLPSLAGMSEKDILEAGDSGLGLGMNIGMGLTGKGVGLGVLGGYESYMFRDGISMKGFVDSELSLIVGYAMEFSIGSVAITGGGDIRPVFRMFGPYGSQTALEAGRQLNSPGKMLEILGDVDDPYYAAGVGFDLGASMSWKGLNLGMTIRDAGDTVMAVSRPVDVNDAMDKLFTLSGFALEEGDADTLSVPMTVDAGFSYAFEKSLVLGLRPDIYLEMGNILHTQKGLKFLENLRGGVEFAAPGPLALRTGYNAGGVSLGLGLQLPIMDIDLSYYRMPAVDGAEEGRHGFALEGRIEF